MSDKERNEFLEKLMELHDRFFPGVEDDKAADATPAAADIDDDWDDLDNIVVLTDEDGNDIEFEFLDMVEYNGHDYVILLPVEEKEAGEVVIMRIEGDGEDETYIGLESEEEAEAVYHVFREKARDDFTFTD